MIWNKDGIKPVPIDFNDLENAIVCVLLLPRVTPKKTIGKTNYIIGFEFIPNH